GSLAEAECAPLLQVEDRVLVAGSAAEAGRFGEAGGGVVREAGRVPGPPGRRRGEAQEVLAAAERNGARRVAQALELVAQRRLVEQRPIARMEDDLVAPARDPAQELAQPPIGDR